LKIVSACLDFVASDEQTTPTDTFRYEHTNMPALKMPHKLNPFGLRSHNLDVQYQAKFLAQGEECAQVEGVRKYCSLPSRTCLR
jgi:hypothetical protein